MRKLVAIRPGGAGEREASNARRPRAYISIARDNKFRNLIAEVQKVVRDEGVSSVDVIKTIGIINTLPR